MSARWEQTSSCVAYEDGRVRVVSDGVIQPDGTHSHYTVVDGLADSVMIIAVAHDDRILFLRQHRYPIDALVLELPGGEIPTGVDPVDHARTELAEEAGLEASAYTSLGRFATWPARARHWGNVVVASGLDLTQASLDGQDGDESIQEVLAIAPSDVRRLIADGSIFDAATLCALAIYWAREGQASAADRSPTSP